MTTLREAAQQALEAGVCCRCYDETHNLLPANCSEKPELLEGSPLGMYHCPGCGAMVCAGVPHGRLCRLCHDRKHPDVDVSGGTV